MKIVNIGLFGFGVVGEGIYQVLTQKPQLGAVIRKIAIKHPDKKRDAPLSLFTTDANEILQDHTIDLVVELIDDSEAALPIVLEAMNNGKSVISANKKMISDHLLLLIETAEKNKVSFLYEASVCGSVPVIRNLEEYFDNDLITSVTGIVNGSTNFILTQMAKHDLSYDVALQKAQELGFAESNPGLDVEGWDARNKLKIISLHAFGKLVDDRNIPVKGINSITKFDINYAKEKGLVIKLIATCKVDEEGTIEEVSVLPTFLPKLHPLRLTDNEFNGILIGGQLSDEQFLYGKGAGRYPTSSAVLSDISAYRYNYKYEYKKAIGIVEAIDPVQCKFYIGFKQGEDVNLSSLGEVEETYQTEGYCYAILCAYPEQLMPLCSSSKISMIRYL